MTLTILINDFIDLLFPRCCEACEKTLIGNEETICTICRISLPRLQEAGLNHDMLKYKFVNVPEILSTHSFLLFTKKGKVQKLLHVFKYRGNKEVGMLLGFMFGQEMQLLGNVPPAELIISVPLHRKKKKNRGYNQSDLLAEGFSKATGIPWTPDALERVHYTETQTGKSKTERRDNVKGVFKAKGNLTCKSVIIIDDVLTTGATLEECVQTLKEAGCEQFYVLTIALAQH